MLLALKLLLVPALVASVSLAGRRWGPRIAGVLVSLPLVAGPVLLFLSLEQGPAFASRAAISTLAAMVGVAAFCVVYAHASLRAWWPATLIAGWLAFVLGGVATHAVAWRPSTALAAGLTSFAVARPLLPAPRGVSAAPRWPAWDLSLRMAAAVMLVLVTTSLAARLGPDVSGVMATFPVVLSVVIPFAHAQQGSDVVLRMLTSFLPSMWSFAVFCFIVAVALEPLGVAAGFALALAAQIVMQVALLAWLRRRAPLVNPSLRGELR